MKTSKYNVLVETPEYQILYNTLSDSIVCFTKSEYAVLINFINAPDLFEEKYPSLFNQMKNAGFFTEFDDELEYVKLKNKLSTFENGEYHLTINPTLDCNLKCWYCSTEFKKAQHQGSMSRETVNAIKNHIMYLVEAKKARHIHLDWFGGEPLLFYNEVIRPIATYSQKLCDLHNVAFSQHITTNSVCMTEEMIKDFVEIGLQNFQIPLDGNEKHHNLIKYNSDKTGTFRTIIRNLNLISEIIPNSMITLRINYDKKTLYGIEEILPLLNDQARQHIEVDFQRVWQILCNQKDYNQLKKIKAIFSKNGFKSGFWAYQPGISNRCYADRFHHYVINYDGNIFKCTAQDYGKDKIIGILNPSGLVNWNLELLSKLFSHATFDNERCLKCNLLPICMGPCIIKNFEARKNNMPVPCVLDNVEYTLDSFIIEEAKRRNLII